MENDFLFQISKEEKEENIDLICYYVDKHKKTKKEIISVPYQIYLKKEDFEALNIKSENIIKAEKEFLDKNQEKVVKIEIKSKELFDFMISEIRNLNIKTFEGDLSEELRFLIETNKKISLNPNKSHLKYICIDIETIGDKENQEIVLISTYNENEEKYNLVYVNLEKLPKDKTEEVKKKKFNGFNIKILKNEQELLAEVQKDIKQQQPQVILGWNVIDFDFNVIRKRHKNFGLEFNYSSYEGQTNMRIAKDFFGKSNLSFPGILVLDCIQILKTNFISFEDFKLNTVAKEVLKDEKIDLEDDGENEVSIDNKIKAIENLLNKDPIKLIEYNFKDSILVSQITKKLNLLDLMIKRSIITDTPIQKISSPIATLDIMYLKELHEQNYVGDSNFNYTATSPIEGAYVLTPKKNFYKDIFVFDFKSLYPSIMMTFNIDPFTFNTNGEIEAPNKAKFSRKPGILPKLILTLYKQRDIAKKENDKVKAHALKITMNSFYGAMASPKSRYYNKDLAQAITAFGREIIIKSEKFLNEKGHKVIYGDTDSVFVKFNKEFNTFEEKTSFGKQIEKELNLFFNQWVENEFKQKSFLEIEMEKVFSNFFIASKKRYVGYDQISNKMMFTGMEAIRGDWTELAKRFQVNLVNLIFKDSSKEKIKEFILEEIKKLKNNQYDNLLIYNKKITKPLEEYTKTTPPHVKAARELDKFDSRLVKYVMTQTGPKHISFIDKNTKYDYEHYIDKQLKGVSDDLLECIQIDFDEIIQSKKQTSLNRFF